MSDESRVPIQVPPDWRLPGRPKTVPERYAREAYKEYADQGHGGQSFERLQERGGFGAEEIMHYLVARCERLEKRIEKYRAARRG